MRIFIEATERKNIMAVEKCLISKCQVWIDNILDRFFYFAESLALYCWSSRPHISAIAIYFLSFQAIIHRQILQHKLCVVTKTTICWNLSSSDLCISLSLIYVAYFNYLFSKPWSLLIIECNVDLSALNRVCHTSFYISNIIVVFLCFPCLTLHVLLDSLIYTNI